MRTSGAAAVLLVPVLAAAGCGRSKGEPRNEPKKIGEQMRDVEADTQVMRDAQAAVNEVIRAASDCEAARPAIPAAIMKLDEAARHVRTAAAHNTLEALRKQVRQVEDLCP